MSKAGPAQTAKLPTSAATGAYVFGGSCPGICLLLALCVLLRPGQARADDFSIAGDVLRPADFTATRVLATMPATPAIDMPPAPKAPLLMPSPDTYLTLTDPELKTYSTTDFRPRGRSILDVDPRSRDENLPMLRGTNVWQRLRDFRSQGGRVRVLTLWECSGGNVSLQASKRGDPSLQWTSQWKGRHDTKRGVLDSLFAVSIAGAATGFRGAASHSGFGQSSKEAPTPARLSAVASSK